jgi:hypothetical protein
MCLADGHVSLSFANLLPIKNKLAPSQREEFPLSHSGGRIRKVLFPYAIKCLSEGSHIFSYYHLEHGHIKV